MAKRKDSGPKPRIKPLIKRALIVPPLERELFPNTLHWGDLHFPESNERALELLNSYSYDAIALQAVAMSEQIIDFLAAKYRYDSLIIVMSWEMRLDRIPEATTLTNAGYTVILATEPILLNIGKDQMLWDTYGNKHPK